LLFFFLVAKSCSCPEYWVEVSGWGCGGEVGGAKGWRGEEVWVVEAFGFVGGGGVLFAEFVGGVGGWVIYFIFGFKVDK
jgi:hypothetical protein